MAVQTISAPLKVAEGESHQVTIAAAGTPTANFLTIVVPDGTTNQDIVKALYVTIAACSRDPVKFRAH